MSTLLPGVPITSQKVATLHPGPGVYDFFPLCLQTHAVRRCWQEEGWMCNTCHQVLRSHRGWAGRICRFVFSVMKPEAKTQSGGSDLVSCPGWKSSLRLLRTERNFSRQPSLLGLPLSATGICTRRKSQRSPPLAPSTTEFQLHRDRSLALRGRGVRQFP